MTDDYYNLIAADNELANIMYSVIHKSPSTAEIRAACKRTHYFLYGDANYVAVARHGWKEEIEKLADALLGGRIRKEILLTARLYDAYRVKRRTER